MKTTAGEIRNDARKPRRSVTCRRRLPRAAPAATVAISGGTVNVVRSSLQQEPRGEYVSGAVASITLDRLTKIYADGTRAVAELDLEIADGELVVFVGPSGCGKT